MEQRTDHVASMVEERSDRQRLDMAQLWHFEEELSPVVGSCTCIEKLLAHF